MDIDEFIDTYSDDLIYLHEARRALCTHPLRADYAFGEYLYASFCRMLAVFVIGALEVMLETWQDRDHVLLNPEIFFPTFPQYCSFKTLQIISNSRNI